MLIFINLYISTMIWSLHASLTTTLKSSLLNSFDWLYSSLAILMLFSSDTPNLFPSEILHYLLIYLWLAHRHSGACLNTITSEKHSVLRTINMGCYNHYWRSTVFLVLLLPDVQYDCISLTKQVTWPWLTFNSEMWEHIPDTARWKPLETSI